MGEFDCNFNWLGREEFLDMMACESKVEAGEGVSQAHQSSLCGVFLAEGMARAKTPRWNMPGMLEKLQSQRDWRGARWEDEVREEVRPAVPLGADGHLGAVGTSGRAGQAGLCVEGHSWWITGRQEIMRGPSSDREARPVVRAEKSSIQMARVEGGEQYLASGTSWT